MLRYIVLSLLALSYVQSDNNTEIEDSCSAEGLWSCLLEEWATSAPQNQHSRRQGRVMALPPTKGYYVSDRMDLMPPPPPHHTHAGHRPPHHGHPHQPAYYEEWQASPPPPEAGKIVNRPTNPYKDQFKPSYEYPHPSQNHPIPLAPPRPQGPGSVDRLDENPPPSPPKRVSETDLYLLTAIEKLVYRVDLMEKRLRKMEESMHYLVAGSEPKPDPCPESFIRVGSICYHFSADALDWKSANLRCRKLRGNLLEFDSDNERRVLHSTLLADKRLRGDDWWTGGLNPGLLWIWSHSAKPVLNDTKANATATQSSNGGILGEGRCLALAHNPAVTAYVYRGQDCSVRNRYVCEREDKARLSNEIEETAKELKQTSKAVKETREAMKETRDAAKENRETAKDSGEVVKKASDVVKDETGRKAKLLWSS